MPIDDSSAPAILADDLDPSTGDFRSIVRGVDPTDAAVLVALRTVRGSGVAVANVGQQFTAARMISQSLESFLREEVAYALRDLTASRQIELESVQVTTGQDWAEILVSYRNLATQQLQQTQLPLGGQRT